MGYTLQQLQQMGYTTGGSTAPTTGNHYTYQQLMNMGYTTGGTGGGLNASQSATALGNANGMMSQSLGQLSAQQTIQGAQTMGNAITQGTQQFASEPTAQPYSNTPIATAAGQELTKTGTLLETGLRTAAGGAQSIFAPFTATMQKLFSHGT